MARTLRRRQFILLAYAAISLPLVVDGALHALGSNANSPLDWVGDDFAPRRMYRAFRAAFGPGDLLIMSWPGCSVEDERLDRLCAVLRKDDVFRDVRGDWYFDRATSGREMLAALTSPPQNLGPDDAAARLRGSFIGQDGKTTFLIVAFNEAGLARRASLVDAIRKAATACCGVPADQQRLAGPVIDGLSVDVASKRSLDRLAAPATIVVFVVAWWSLGSLAGAIAVCGIALYCQAAGLALVHYNGDEMNALLIVMPPLIQALAVAGGVHLANYYFNARPEGDPDDAARTALRVGWLPCVLSGATTALGLLSLRSSRIDPIRSFGQYAAFATVLTTGLLLALLPGFLSMCSTASSQPRRGGRGAALHLWRVPTLLVKRFHVEIVVAGLLLMGASALGIRHLTTSVRIETLFSSGSRILDDYAWIERHVGPLVPIEIVVACAADCNLSAGQRLALVSRMHEALEQVDHVGATWSASRFMPRLPPEIARDTPAYEALLDRVAATAAPTYIRAGLLRQRGHRELWRLTANVSALEPMDYGTFLDDVKRRIESIAADDQGQPLPGVSVFATGIMPLVHEIQRQLLRDLLRSFMAAFVLIFLTMVAVEGGVLVGLVAMIPNVFPVLLLFGALGWSRTALDIGSVMTASVALGIAVDDTLHFLAFFRRGLGNGLGRQQAVLEAYRHCGPAMIQTSLICGMGIGVFVLSDFVPTSRFAWIMAAQLAAALVGDLILLPAVLIGPIGRLFEDGDRHGHGLVPHTRRLGPKRLVVPRRVRTARSGDAAVPLR